MTGRDFGKTSPSGAIAALPMAGHERRGAIGRAYVERCHARPLLTARWAEVIEEAARG